MRGDFRNANPAFFVALGAFRKVIGYEVARLAVYYGLDIEGDLASVLPSGDFDDPNSDID